VIAFLLPYSPTQSAQNLSPIPNDQPLGILSQLRPTYHRFSAYMRPDLTAILLGCVLMAGIAATNTAMIWLIGEPVDLLNKGQYDAVRHILLIFAIIVTFNQALHLGTAALRGWLELRFIGRVREAMLARCLLASSPAVDRHQQGDLLARLSGDVDRTARLIVDTPLVFASHVLIFIFYAGMLVWIDLKLSLIALAISPVFLLHQRYFGHRKQRISQHFLSKLGRLLSFESETLKNLRGISSFNAETRVAGMHHSTFHEASKWALKDKLLNAWFDSSFSMLIYMSGLVIVLTAMFAMNHAGVTVGHLVSFLLYLGYISVPVRGLAELALECRQNTAAAERITEILDIHPEVTQQTNALPLNVSGGMITFDNISFGYSEENPVIEGFSLQIAPGETVALAGPSGAGKSTLVKLLMRFYDPLQGTIKIDGTDIRSVAIASLRSQIAVVWQDPFLLNDTIRNNLLLARPDASETALLDACKNSHAWEFITKLEHGLDTLIGADGTELSAGQRQRLSLAQAFLRDAPILLLDEASSALDSHAERMAIEALERLRKGRTTIIVAHRHSAIRTANRIAYFNGDGSVTVASHAHLLDMHPGYRAAAQWQTAPTNNLEA